MRAYLPIAVAISAFLSVAQAAPAFSQVMYQIELNLIEEHASGKENRVFAPRVMALEGQPACIDVGYVIQPPKDAVLHDSLRGGRYFLVSVFRKSGRVFLDATARLDDAGQADANGVRITTTGLRVVQAITLGQKITVPLPLGQEGRWELLVQEAQKKTTSNDKSIPAAAPPVAKAVPGG
jgi:hypothetical protein